MQALVSLALNYVCMGSTASFLCFTVFRCNSPWVGSDRIGSDAFNAEGTRLSIKQFAVQGSVGCMASRAAGPGASWGWGWRSRGRAAGGGARLDKGPLGVLSVDGEFVGIG